jgi:membrane fusion protein, multidrug efflux system
MAALVRDALMRAMAISRNIVATAAVAIALVALAWGMSASRKAERGEPASAATAKTDAAITVVTAPVRKERIAAQLNALGTARANEAVEITSKASNRVMTVRFRDGEQVRKGQVLVELDSAQARADLAEAEATRVESASQVERSRGLVATHVVSQAQYELLEATLKANTARVAAARARLEDTVVRAPFSGRVGLRRVSVGSLVNPGTVITTLDDTSLIKLDFTVPENFLASLREGLTLTATAAAFPGREFTGRVASVDSRVDPTTRAVMVRAELPNPDGTLRPGMFLSVELARDEREALMIPEAALVPEQSRQYVFVVENGRAARREVQIGQRQPGRVEIVSGLEAGDQVVVEGTQKVRDGGPVRAAVEA